MRGDKGSWVRLGLASLLLALACGGGGGSSHPAQPPGRALSSTANATATAIAATSDGGLAILGTAASGTLGGSDLLLVRTDGSGNVAWTSSFGGPGNERGSSVRQTSDGGFVLAGTTDDAALAGGPGGLLVVKTDALGRLSWQRTYGGVVATRQADKVAVLPTSDGGYVLAGTVPGAEFNPEPDAILLKLDADGAPAWHASFGNEAGNVWAEGYDVQEAADGGFVLAGAREAGPGFAVKVDAGGATQWEQAFGALSGPIFSVRATSDGGWLYVGRHDAAAGASALLVKGTGSGQLAWERTVGPLTGGGSVVTGERTADGGVVVATVGAARNGDAYVVRADASGNELWSRTFGGDAPDAAGAVIQRPDGGFVVVGGTASFGPTAAIYFLALDGNGAPQ